MNKKLIAIVTVGLVALVSVSVVGYEVYYSPQRISCPNIFATVSLLDAKGFVMTTHPTAQITEFVLPPSSVGRITVSYSSQANSLSTGFFTDQVPVWKANLVTGSLDPSSELSVTITSLTSASNHQAIGNYSLTSGPSNGLFVLGLPSTCLSYVVNVGTQPYNGPMSWMNGTRA